MVIRLSTPKDSHSTIGETDVPDSAGSNSLAGAVTPANADIRDANERTGGYSVLRHPAAYARFLFVAAAGLALDLWSKFWAFHTLGQGDHTRVVIPHVLEFQTMLNHGALFGIGAGQTKLFLVASACALLLVFWMFAQSGPRSWALHLALGGILAGALGNMYDRVNVKLLDQALPGARGPVYVAKTGADDEGFILKQYPTDRDGAEFRMRVSPDAADAVITRHPRGMPIHLNGAPEEVGFVRDYLKIPTRWFGREMWPWVFNVADMLLVCGVAILAVHLWRDRKQPEAAMAV
jgi:lipoprotein signal peptidase